MSDVNTYINLLGQHTDLTREQSADLFVSIMSGEVAQEDIKNILLLLKQKGETVDEITGAAQVLRQKATHIHAPAGALDTCGTGGDGGNTFNISTAAAFVVAACGVTVAKHGNRAVSSASGSADVLQQLGVNIDAPLYMVESAIKDIGIGFMMAPMYHTAMRHVAAVRKELATRTIFNLLGPLINPASADYQLLGVFDKAWLEPIAHTLHLLGVKRAWVVYGGDGLDELTVTTKSHICSVDEEGNICHFTIRPEEYGITPASIADLTGGSSKHNAEALKRLFEGEQGAYRDIVVLNSAAALVLAGKAEDLHTGVRLASAAIDNKKALDKLNALVQYMLPENIKTPSV